MTDQEQQLIDKLNAKPGTTVVPYRNGGGVLVIQERPNGVRQSGVWLGKPRTIERLTELLVLREPTCPPKS